MVKYFGTDGIRGDANGKLTVDLALKVGKYLGHLNKGKKLVVGQDTRLSSTMFASALAAGATSMGADVYMLGVCATPGLAYVIAKGDFEGGVMISASHNPYYDNGLKVFASNGMKISNEMELEIESYVDGEIQVELAKDSDIGIVVDYGEGLNTYTEYLKSLIDVRFNGLTVALDMANGSAVSSARNLFEQLGATVIAINENPDGVNINTDCGSTHPDKIMKLVKETGADLGFAFDGDADRCLAVNNQGKLVDGDEILYIMGLYLHNAGELKDDMVVTTVMANLGFMKSCDRVGLKYVTTDVGDKNVFAEMVANDYKLGGEQSGHIILRDYATTGDGVLTALVLTEIVVKAGLTLSELGKDFEQYPQLLKNLKIADKDVVMNHPSVIKGIEEASKQLGDDGRILVRPSGTEQLIRVMVEAKTDELCEYHVSSMLEIIKSI